MGYEDDHDRADQSQGLPALLPADDIRASRSGRILRRSVKPTSILLEQDLIERLREKGAKRGLGYQTMLKVIVREHLDDY
jgi:predicted DNA binding CopG/RHH family protein